MTSSYSSSSGIYLGGDSSGGGEGAGSYIDGESFGRGGGGGGGSYVVSSVSKVRSSSSGGARRAQTAGSSGGLSPAFRERKTISSRSGGYDGEALVLNGEQWKNWHMCRLRFIIIFFNFREFQWKFLSRTHTQRLWKLL